MGLIKCIRNNVCVYWLSSKKLYRLWSNVQVYRKEIYCLIKNDLISFTNLLKVFLERMLNTNSFLKTIVVSLDKYCFVKKYYRCFDMIWFSIVLYHFFLNTWMSEKWQNMLIHIPNLNCAIPVYFLSA